MTDQASRIYYGFEQAYEYMEAEVERRLFSSPQVIRGYTSHLAKARGKFIRARALLTCSMNEENLVPREAVTLAAAIELLHLATLVHDDVIDNADLRRGVITLQKKFGKKIAVICGDYLLSVALEMASSIPDKEQYMGFELPGYISRLCMGELRQELNNGNLELSLYRYLSIIDGKTAALFEAAFYGGAILADKDPARLSGYRRLGRYTGIIFQLTDDCIDYETKQSDARKNVRSDYDQGVITLPLIYALYKDAGLSRRLENKEISSEQLYPEVRRAGGPDFTRMIAGRYYKKAIAVLDRLSIPPLKRELLIGILDKSYYGLKKKEETLKRSYI